MLNHANRADDNGSNKGCTVDRRSPATQAPPCTMIATGKGPSPSGMLASIWRLNSPARPYSIFSRSSALLFAANIVIKRKEILPTMFLDARAGTQVIVDRTTGG